MQFYLFVDGNIYSKLDSDLPQLSIFQNELLKENLRALLPKFQLLSWNEKSCKK